MKIAQCAERINFFAVVGNLFFRKLGRAHERLVFERKHALCALGNCRELINIRAPLAAADGELGKFAVKHLIALNFNRKFLVISGSPIKLI